MKDAGVAIKAFFGLTRKMYLFSADDSHDHKIRKNVNRNIVAAISHNK